MLYKRGYIDPKSFETEVIDMAVRSQAREGLTDPYGEEAPDTWETRMERVRDHITDLYFSRHFTFEVFQGLVIEVLKERGVKQDDLLLSYNPELAPLDLVFEQAKAIEGLPLHERARYEPRLQECKVVIIRALISDQLRYINIAKEWFTLADLSDIRHRKLASGRIGGKAAGMLLAERILREEASQETKDCLQSAESYFLGADGFYNFMSANDLAHWNDQKYKTEEQMREDYPKILADYEMGKFPPDMVERFENLLETVGNKPLIVRSSSLLEDNFGTSFAGKYESYFLPNQGTPEENLLDLTNGIARVYASTLDPNALLYRRSKGLIDYDERMAILIQVVKGERVGRYYFPHAAGVAFSRNLYRWAPQIKRDAGFVRLVWGLGTRAVDRVGNDFPRLVALSHPTLRPSSELKSIKRYSQQFIDLIDLEDNTFRTLPVGKVLTTNYKPLRYLAQVDQGGYLSSIRSSVVGADLSKLVLTFDGLINRIPFAKVMKDVLRTLEKSYRSPVDMEFAVHISQNNSGKPELCLTILQCRPQAYLTEIEQAPIPVDLSKDETVFSTRFVVPQGQIKWVDYVVFVPPEGYFSLPTMNDRTKLARLIGQLNAAMSKESFICVGPGRWGSSNSDLGVPIKYGDIYNSRSLVELAGPGIGAEPEPSLGTHFFQDLLEGQIYPLAIVLNDPETIFNRDFFYDAPDCLREWVDVESEELARSLRVIRVSDFMPKHHMRVIMDDEQSQAVAFFEAN
jgi:hypothetical protein